MIQMATRSDRLRGASHAALIAEADRQLAAIKFATCDLERDLRRARICLANGHDPIDGDTAHHYQQLAAIAGDIGDLLSELGADRCSCTQTCDRPCRGQCGCVRCANDYNDFLSVER